MFVQSNITGNGFLNDWSPNSKVFEVAALQLLLDWLGDYPPVWMAMETVLNKLYFYSHYFK
jgi:hypothetical protein